MNPNLKKLQNELTSEFCTSANFFSKFYVGSIRLQNKAYDIGYQDALKNIQTFALQNAASSSSSINLGVLSVDKLLSFIRFMSKEEDNKLNKENSKPINTSNYQTNSDSNNSNIPNSSNTTNNSSNTTNNSINTFGSRRRTPNLVIGTKRTFEDLNFDTFYDPNFPNKKRKLHDDENGDYDDTDQSYQMDQSVLE